MKIGIRSLIAAAAAVIFSIAAVAAVPGKLYATNMYGGAIYDGSPSLALTASLVKAGGGSNRYSLRTALVSMLGQKGADDEINKLTQQYGDKDVQAWIEGSNWMIATGLDHLQRSGMNVPEAQPDMNGSKLATALVNAGIAPDDTSFWSGRLYDHLFSHPVNAAVVKDMDRTQSQYYAKNMYAINNQAMYDIAQSLDTHNVRLAQLH